MFLNPNKIFNQFAVYLLTTDSDNYYHVGVCQYKDVILTPDARKFDQFDRAANYTLHILNVFDTRAEALKARENLNKTMNKNPTLYQLSVDASRQMLILCEQSGNLYKTQAQCANAEGIAQSALSPHLNFRAGYKTINGKTFKRIELKTPEARIAHAKNQINTLKDLQKYQ